MSSAQQRAITAPHQGQSILDQPDGSAAQIIGLPGAPRRASCAVQDVGDFAVRMAFRPSIHRTSGIYHALALLSRQPKSWGPEGTIFERRPEPVSGPQANIEIGVES
jgi:hypothetical protein